MPTKTCTTCKIERPVDEFYPGRGTCTACRSAYQRARYERNREAIKQRVKEWNVANKERRTAYRASRRERDKVLKQSWDLRQKYGLTSTERDNMLASQGGMCQICRTDRPKGRGWCVDHCHKTGRVRGILCANCNAMLGFARESSWVLENAAVYMECHDAYDVQ